MPTQKKKPEVAPVLDAIKDFIRTYVVLSDDQLEVVAHYVLHTHQFSERCQQPFTTPYLFINSAQKGSGKTLLGIDILGALCRNFEAVNNVTPATLFRLTNMRATIGIDEVDMLFGGNRSDDDLVSTLNTGYRKGGYVPRADAKEEDGVKRYDTFCPKLLIGIDSGTMRDTTRDRCIPINMVRATDAERATVKPLRMYRVTEQLEQLAEDIHTWSFENTLGMRDYDPEEIENLTPRQWEVCVPLIQVAAKTGREQAVREALTRIFEAMITISDTPELEMLTTLKEMLEESGIGKVKSADLLARLQRDPRFRHWTGKMLATRLAPFGIRVKGVRFGPSDVQRAITMTDAHDAFVRYLGV
jgi:hypothetical protein